MLKTYFNRILDIAKPGDATEQSYYSSLEELLKSYAVSINKKQVHVTTIPKKTDAGNPDLRKGALIDKILIRRPYVVHKPKTIPPLEKEADLYKLPSQRLKS